MMTTTVYNRRSLGIDDDFLAASSPIDVRIESEATPEAISQFLISLAAFIRNSGAGHYEEDRTRDRHEVYAYYQNRYGGEYALVDELGFETSHMGARADLNHIF